VAGNGADLAQLLAAGEPPLSDPRGVQMAEAQKRLVREYETIYLLKADTPDEQVDDIKERLRAVVTREGGKVIKFTNQGKRKVAFPLAKNPRAVFIHCLYVGNPGLVGEFERNLKMIDLVQKYQSVKLADGVDFDARQVEQDVKITVEEERPREAGAAEFGERPDVAPFGAVEAVEEDRGEE
jgi:small subunit ribosomal protein S6